MRDQTPSKPIAFKADTFTEERLPFPIVLYPGHYGAFFAFKQNTDSAPRLVDLVADKLNIDLRIANTSLLFNESGFLTEVISQGDEKYAKLQHLKNLCAQEGLELADCVCIGDGANDIELFRAPHQGVTFINAPNVVKECAWKVIDELSDVKNLL